MKHAVVTGGAKGIGLGAVRELTNEGWRCTVLDIDPAGQGVAEEIGGTFVQVDVTQPGDLRRVFADIAGQFGPLHGLVNSAGINRTGPSADSRLLTGSGSSTSTCPGPSTPARPPIRTWPRARRS